MRLSAIGILGATTLTLAACQGGAAKLLFVGGEVGGSSTTGGAPGGAGAASEPASSSGVEGGGTPIDYSCAGRDCPACASGSKCSAGDWIGDTCCSHGDALDYVGTAEGAEVVDIESDGELTLLCGGFGVRINRMTPSPSTPTFVGSITSRCQHASFGAEPATGGRFIHVTHHGDSWVNEPFLKTIRITSDDKLQEVDSLTEPGVLYEGHAWADGYLYVAAHGDGLRVYNTDAEGKITFLTSLGGFDNAWKATLWGDTLYVADNGAGVGVVDVSDPAAPSLLTTVATTGPPRDLEMANGRLVVALGGFGVDVFDVTEPHAPSAVTNIETLGSAQAVSGDDGAIAVAVWNHVALYDATDFRLIATEKNKGYPAFEQDVGVSMVDNLVYVGEWSGQFTLRYRQGYVAPDLWIEQKLFQLDGDQQDARAVVMRNRGELPLVIDGATVNHPSFSIGGTFPITIERGGGDFFEVLYEPPGPPQGIGNLTVSSNDPDGNDATYRAGLITKDGTLLDVGDPLDSSFAFLDPGGLAALEGKVIVLAYFALF